MKPKPAPRIFGILARKAPIVAIFRRGPSKQVALLEWNLDTNRVDLGQWLKGRIYERRADLSPDGRTLIYFAANHRWSSDRLGGSWTAVSRMPYLRAMHLYAWGHCWNGGGLFIDDKTYWLNDGGSFPKTDVWRTDFGVSASDRPPAGVTPGHGEDPVTYIPRLIRDGWREVDRGPFGNGHFAVRFEKRVCRGWMLEKTFRMGVAIGPHGECYHDDHRLIGRETTIDFPADWVEVRKSELLFGKDGSLWRQAVHPLGPDTAKMIADLTDMTFAAIPAPYAGVTVPPAEAAT